ncbi:MAG: hypothetical protein ACK4IK_09290 [Bacteroidia bacterium]
MYKLFILLIVLFVYTSCRKYEEDPYTVIFKSPEKRLLGSWRYSRVLIDGVDETQNIATTETHGWIFVKDERIRRTKLFISFNGYNSNIHYNWRLIDKDTKLVTEPVDISYLPDSTKIKYQPQNIYWERNTPIEWNIKALNNKELKLHALSLFGSEYEISFKKVK